MGANDYMYTGVQRDAAATVSKRQPYCVLINYVASSLFVYVATTLTILRRPIEACYVGLRNGIGLRIFGPRAAIQIRYYYCYYYYYYDA